MSQKYHLLIFDWEGTLADTAYPIVHAIQQAIHDVGLPGRTDARIMKNLHLPQAELLRTLFPKQDKQKLLMLLERYNYHSYTTAPVAHLFLDVHETLKNLSAQKYSLAVATNKSTRGLEQAIIETELTGVFAATRTAEQTSLKPHPQMLFELMDELDSESEQTLLVGDSPSDIQMAQSAGITAIAAAYTPAAVELLAPYQPTATIESFSALLAVLSQQ